MSSKLRIRSGAPLGSIGRAERRDRHGDVASTSLEAVQVPDKWLYLGSIPAKGGSPSFVHRLWVNLMGRGCDVLRASATPTSAIGH